MDWDVVVVGAGAAGLLAASGAAERGRRVLLLEKNRKAGVKILMSGGTRCNVTHDTDRRGIVEAFGRRGSFLHSSLAALGPAAIRQLLREEGVATKVESTGKVFPTSNKALDVLQALLRRLHRSGAELALDEAVLDLRPSGEGWEVRTARGLHRAASVVLTTGGQSYPGCGTTGDGYAWAAACGHRIVPPRPALVPLTTTADWVRQLSGITVPDVDVRLVRADQENAEPAAGKSGGRRGGKKSRPLAQRRGSFLFTHFGLSGPVVMDVSGAATEQPEITALELICNFAPGVHETEWLDALQRGGGKTTVLNVLASELPRRLAEALLPRAGVPLERKLAELSRRERADLVDGLTETRIPLHGTLGFRKAEVTAGGVSLDDVDSSTLRSKRTPGLFLAGEILDLDGPIGGYNFQAAFSTGWLAGRHA